MAVAGGADEARVMLEALEAGVDGVLLRTEDVLQVCCRRPGRFVAHPTREGAAVTSVQYCCRVQRV
jgi:3-dehydroquinate synthase class II